MATHVRHYCPNRPEKPRAKPDKWRAKLDIPIFGSSFPGADVSVQALPDEFDPVSVVQSFPYKKADVTADIRKTEQRLSSLRVLLRICELKDNINSNDDVSDDDDGM